MSEEGFYGWVPPVGYGSLRFDMCEVCRRKAPIWVETKHEDMITEIRLVCDDCHQGFIDQTANAQMEEDQDQDQDQVEDQISDEEKERPAWMKEFIAEQEEAGSLETIGEETLNEEKQAYLEDMETQESNESFMNDELIPSSTQSEVENVVTAPWSADFIKEALFGPNPEDWLEKQGAYQKEEIELTLHTLTQLNSNNVSSVKLSAILCLAGLTRRDSSFKDRVISSIKLFEADTDTIVSDFASQTKDSLR